MNSWEPTQTGSLKTLDKGHYLVYRTEFTPHRSQQIRGGRIQIKGLTGKAEVWLNGELLGIKPEAEPTDLILKFPSEKEKCQLSILIEGKTNDKVGLNGHVSVLD